MKKLLQWIVLAGFVIVLGVSAAAQSPWIPPALPKLQRPVPEISFAYTTLHSNAPVGGCGCFWMDGGSIEYALPFRRGLDLVGELSGEHTSAIPGSGSHGLDLASAMGGIRVGRVLRRRYTPFAQGLAGIVYAFDSEFPSGQKLESSVFALAMAAGGGVDISVSRRFRVRAIQAEYHFMELPNNANNEQHNLRVSVGFVYRFLR